MGIKKNSFNKINRRVDGNIEIDLIQQNRRVSDTAYQFYDENNAYDSPMFLEWS